MAQHGGKREGSGRKKGSKTLQLRDYLKQQDIDTFVEFLLANYMEDGRLMIWMGDHIFGKAVQPLSGPDGEPLFNPDAKEKAQKALGEFVGEDA